MTRIYTALAAPATRLYSWSKQRKGQWSSEGIRQRWGKQFPEAPPTRPVWIHAASMGEVRVGAILGGALGARGINVLGSAMTETGFELIRKTFPNGTIGIRAPFDTPHSVGRLFSHFQPMALVLVETEWWPNMLASASRHDLPVFVVNGRVSAGGFRWYRLSAAYWRNLLSVVTRFYMRSNEDADRLLALGVAPSRVEVAGPMKSAGTVSTSPGTLEKVRSSVGNGSRVWIAASTRPGEEEIVLDAQAALADEFPTLQLWLAPRHPERFEDVAAKVLQRGLLLSRWSDSKSDPGFPTRARIMLIDCMGILPELFEFADVAFVGGSLRPFGGHNPLEPALAGTPVVFGPHMESQKESADWLLAEKLAHVAGSATELAGIIRKHLNEKPGASQRRELAERVGARHRGTIDRVAEDILRRLRLHATQKS